MPLDTLEVTLETIFSANHLTDETGSTQPITRNLIKNQIFIHKGMN